MRAPERLLHCFGGKLTHRVDTATAVAMLHASGCRHLAVNTHNVYEIDTGEELAVGYGDATYGSVTAAFELGALTPVINVNLPTSVREAVQRVKRAHELTGITLIKLEVLDAEHRVTVNSAVIKAAELLREEEFEVWPLLTPDVAAAESAQQLGCTLLRIMGSPIGSRAGVQSRWESEIDELLAAVSIPTMLDGGIGDTAQAQDALIRGFDSVLVNSCLFNGDRGPVAELDAFAVALSISTAVAR